MSKAIFVVTKHRLMGIDEERRLQEICKKLTPDIIADSSYSSIKVNGKTAFAIVNDTPCVSRDGDSLLLGLLYGSVIDWSKPRSGTPDGSYALFRSDKDHFEIVSDPAGSRTIWYYLDEDHFIASTSQRAIIKFLGDFEFDPRTIPWMLSTGSLGPTHSWDRRLHRLGPDTSLTLDRRTWVVSETQEQPYFGEVRRTSDQHLAILTAAIRETVGYIDPLILDKWALPLSGGYDSRALLCFISDLEGAAEKLLTLTWGVESALELEHSDAQVARCLSRSLGVVHHYYHLDLSKEPIDEVIERFIVCGEGRIDHLAGYMDGFETWRVLSQSGICGVLRGDEGFGWQAVHSREDVVHSIGCSLCEDFSNISQLSEEFGLPTQSLPVHLQQKQGESLELWRDRLYHAYRIPTVLAALSDLKLAFVEQASPLLSRRILHQVRELPDHLRTNKALFKRVVDEVSPNVRYATSSATAPVKEILSRPDMVDFLRRSIDSPNARRLFDARFIEMVLTGLGSRPNDSQSRSSSASKRLRNLLPDSIKSRLKNFLSKRSLDKNILAFRVFLILRMHELLTEDVRHSNSSQQL